LLLLKVEVL